MPTFATDQSEGRYSVEHTRNIIFVEIAVSGTPWNRNTNFVRDFYFPPQMTAQAGTPGLPWLKDICSEMRFETQANLRPAKFDPEGGLNLK